MEGQQAQQGAIQQLRDAMEAVRAELREVKVRVADRREPVTAEEQCVHLLGAMDLCITMVEKALG